MVVVLKNSRGCAPVCTVLQQNQEAARRFLEVKDLSTGNFEAIELVIILFFFFQKNKQSVFSARIVVHNR